METYISFRSAIYWDGAALVLATPRSSPPATNVLREVVARVGVSPTRDVVLVDGRESKAVRSSGYPAGAGYTRSTAEPEAC
jgi:hypothetical protein